MEVSIFFQSGSKFSTFCSRTVVCAVSSRCLGLTRELGLFTGSIHLILPFLCCLLQPLIIAIEWRCGTKSHAFPPTPGKYLAIVLEENNKKSYQIAHRVLLHPHKDIPARRCETRRVVGDHTAYATDSPIRSVNQRTIPVAADPF